MLKIEKVLPFAYFPLYKLTKTLKLFLSAKPGRFPPPEILILHHYSFFEDIRNPPHMAPHWKSKIAVVHSILNGDGWNLAYFLSLSPLSPVPSLVPNGLPQVSIWPPPHINLGNSRVENRKSAAICLLSTLQAWKDTQTLPFCKARPFPTTRNPNAAPISLLWGFQKSTTHGSILKIKERLRSVNSQQRRLKLGILPLFTTVKPCAQFRSKRITRNR